MEKVQLMEEAIGLIFDELKYAEEKHPGFPTDPMIATMIMTEECGEAVKAANDFAFSEAPLDGWMKEVAQTGAMALRILISQRLMKEDGFQVKRNVRP